MSTEKGGLGILEGPRKCHEMVPLGTAFHGMCGSKMMDLENHLVNSGGWSLYAQFSLLLLII